MIIGAHLHAAAPHHGAGAEWTIQDLFAALAQRGHDCRIVADTGPTRERIDEVLIYSNAESEVLAQHYQECDVMLTQLDATMQAQLMAASYQTPLVPYIHSPTQLTTLGCIPSCCPLVLFNSHATAEAQAWWPGDSMVLRPPVSVPRVRLGAPPRGACPTLVNTSHNKGGLSFFGLARSMPGVMFLAVQGVYGDQVLTPNGIPGAPPENTFTPLPENLRVMIPQARIADALQYARCVMMLSDQESYGRVAQEAMINGIPVISTETAGVRECCGDAAIYVDRDDTTALKRAVNAMFNEDEWVELSIAALDKAHENVGHTAGEIIHMEHALRKLVAQSPIMSL